MNAINYENFIKAAFSLDAGTLLTQQASDPAGLADTGYFDSANLRAVIVGAGYAMGVFHNNILRCDGNHHNLFEYYLTRVLASSSVKEVTELIEGFERDLVNQYFEISESGIHIPKLPML